MLGLMLWSVLAQAPTPISAPPEKHVIILTGGKDAAEGKARLDAAMARSKVWAEVLWKGHFAPVLVDSAQVPGLKPGFHVVLWGVCDGLSAADASLELAKAVEPGAYHRRLAGFPTAVQSLPCPHESEGFVVGPVLVAKGKSTDLRVVLFNESRDPAGDYRKWRAVVTLVGKNGAVLEERILEKEDVLREFGNDCIPSFEVAKGSVVIGLRECMVPRGCPTPAVVDGKMVLSPGENQVMEATKVTRKHAAPCAGE